MKMSNKNAQRLRKAMSFALTAGLVVSSLATSSVAGAASGKAPKLGDSKKTLYYNKSGKKSATLKVKKNGVGKIKKTTWKTSNKKVVTISSKKATSVKLTALKAGKATITATVKYTLKGSKKVKKKISNL